MQTVTIALSGHFTDGYPVMGQFASEPNTYDVPPGQNLVIESMSAFAGVPHRPRRGKGLNPTAAAGRLLRICVSEMITRTS